MVDPMKQKKQLFLSILLILGIALCLWTGRDRKPDPLPQASRPGTVTLASNGCCFWAENIRVWLDGPESGPVEISFDPALSENDVFSHPLTDAPGGPLELNVEFHCFYGDDCLFSMPVKHFDSFDELEQNGVLLYFQEHDDMYLNVISGDYHGRYKMGFSENRWSSQPPLISRFDRMPYHRPPLFRRGPSRVGQIDFMVQAVPGEIVLISVFL